MGFKTPNIKKPNQLDKLSIWMYPVWALPYPLLTRSTINEILDECKQRIEYEKKTDGFLTDLEREQKYIYKLIHNELSIARIKKKEKYMYYQNFREEEYQQIMPCPRILHLENFIEEARVYGAMIFLAVHEKFGLPGQLQNLLERKNILYTGVNSKTAILMANKYKIFRHLEKLYSKGIGAALKHVISSENILEMLEKDPLCEDMYAYIHRLITPMGKSFSIKPEYNTSHSAGVRLEKASDMALYLHAIRDKWNLIGANSLSRPHEDIELTKSHCNYILEMFVAATPVTIYRDPTGIQNIEFVCQNRWIKVVVTLIGKKNNIRSMKPSLMTIKSGKIVFLSLPLTIIMPEKTIRIMNKVEQVTKSLSLRGTISLEIFTDVETSFLVVIGISNALKIFSFNQLLQQATTANSPMFSVEIFLGMFASIIY